jgi:hypothetical protein
VRPAREARLALDNMSDEAVTRRYNNEARDLDWAPAMEQTLRGYFSEEVLRALHLEGVSLREMECRSQTCRVEVDFPAESFEHPPVAAPRGYRRFTAATAILEYAGEFADKVASSIEPVPNASQPTIRWSAVVAFYDGHRDPQSFRWHVPHPRPAASPDGGGSRGCGGG